MLTVCVSGVPTSVKLPVTVTLPFSLMVDDESVIGDATGFTLVTLTDPELTAVLPALSVTRRLTVRDVGPSRPKADNDTFCPEVSNEPLLSRSQA